MIQFALTEEQYKQAVIWMKERRRYSGAIGGQFSYVFTPTSFGEIIKIVDGEDSLDLTDFDNW